MALTYATARVAVHFTAVTEKFTPHDSIISVTTAEELSDAALTSACSLHTAAPSSCSSSGSSKRHKLDEITEDAEEGQSNAGDSAETARPVTAASSKPVIVEPAAKSEDAEGTNTATAAQETKAAEGTKGTPELSHVTIETVTETKEQVDPKAASHRDSFKNYDSLFEHGPDPRMSSQTARPALADLYAEIYAQYSKPKVKLGPRPKQSLDIKRPHTSGDGVQGASRPVSSLPPGLRAGNRKKAEPKRPKSRDTSIVPSIAFSAPPPVPAIPDMPSSPSYLPKGPASVKSMPINAHSSRNHRSTGITPEKQRLMKALELRKKQMKALKEREAKAAEAAAESADTGAGAEAKDSEIPAEKSSPEQTAQVEEDRTASKSEVEPATSQDVVEEIASNQGGLITDETKPPSGQEDQSAEVTAAQTETDDLHSAASASSPTSAQTQGSSCAPSTRPSSISEDDHHAPADETKPVDTETSLGAGDEKPTGSSEKEDEEDSIESSPTVVPENRTPVPSVKISSQPEEPAPATLTPTPDSDAFLSRRSKRESMVLMPPTDPEDPRSRRKSNRESMIYMPLPETPGQDEAQSRKQKRESMILTAPIGQSFLEGKDKRRAVIDPVHLSAENSEAEYLSDDSFMEELQSAKLEEAKPISVSKSPITPFFPRKASVSEYSILERSSSQQYIKPGRLTPEQPSSRKSSGPWLTHANTDTVVTAKKINVSSGISQRIKALAEKSNRDSSASVSPVATPDASNSIVAQRKSSFFSTPPSGNSPEGKPIQRLSRASFANRATSPTPNKKPVLQPPPKTIELNQPTVYNKQKGSQKPESVQVTARIVRDARVQKPTLTMPTENTPLELHQSPIIIDHQRLMRPPSSTKHSPTKAEPTSPRPPSSSHSREASSSALPRSSSESSWRSFGRRLSESRSPGAPPRSMSIYSFESGDEKREEKKEKKDSRTSKLFKRMSSISSISRKNSAASATLPEEDFLSTLPSLREPPPPVQVGDLNIQFPDTLVSLNSSCHVF